MKTIEFCDSFINIANRQSNRFAEIFSEPYMQSRLIVKNFGPIEEVDLDLRNVNVFIGPQASGKSALAKIYTIFKAPRKFFDAFERESETEVESNKKIFLDVLEEYNISSFLKPNSQISFTSELHDIEYENGKIKYDPKLYRKIKKIEELSKNFNENKNQIVSTLTDLGNDFILFKIRATFLLRDKDTSRLKTKLQDIYSEYLTEADLAEIIDIISDIENNLSSNTALYIPSERNITNIIKKASLNLIKNNVPIPKHILSFGAELEKINIAELSLDFLSKGLTYKNINGEERIYTDNQNSIKLGEAASGIQSVIPILIPIIAKKDDINHRSFVIEEPELNLFPSAQYDLIQYLESSRRESFYEDYGTIHTYTTHSPYILSAINNLLYANKVSSNLTDKDDGSKRAIEEAALEIVKAEINPYYFTAYQIKSGHAESIFDRDTGLIIGNYIDECSDRINEDFEALMELIKDGTATN